MNAAGPSVLPLDAVDLAVASCLVAVAGAVSLGLRLGLERRLAIAALRTVVQLSLVGYLLEWVFALANPWVVALVFVFMVGAAAHAALQRPSRRLRGFIGSTFLTLMLTGTLCTAVVTQLIVRVDPWYQPRYVIPLLGMVLGNSLTGISLCIDTLLESLVVRGDQVEADLALGATRWEAMREPLSSAVKRGLIPIINMMSVAGLVSLPGIMTGQILAGASPLDAVKYQVVIMFMLAGATSLGATIASLLIYRRLFNERHQLRSEQIIAHKER